MVAAFQQRRDVIVRALNEIDGITCATPKGAFYLFPNIYGVATLDRKSFGVIGSEGKHYLRISIATSLDDLEEAVVRIAAAATDRAGFRRFVDEGEHLT